MKVVLFCGGQGMRIRDYSESIPKPMIPIGQRPILWNLMKYYASFGHKDFIICLGYKGDVIKSYFWNYQEHLSNDFVLAQGGKEVKLLNQDITDWNITFVDTGFYSNIGQRLMCVKKFLTPGETFMANYSDGLSDLALDAHLAHFERHDVVGSFMTFKSTQSFHVVRYDNDNFVSSISPISSSGYSINCGYFILKYDIFDYMNEGDELVEEPFQRLIAAHKLLAYPHEGFWLAMDTFKDKQMFDDMVAKGIKPWETWNTLS
jgi:glucose-1-phosphate cytidylyltransferase